MQAASSAGFGASWSFGLAREGEAAAVLNKDTQNLKSCSTSCNIRNYVDWMAMDIEWTYILVHGDNFINILLHNTMGNGWSVLQEISPTPGWNRTRKLCTLWNVTVVFSLGFLSGGQGLLFLLLYRHSYLEGRTIILFLRSITPWNLYERYFMLFTIPRKRTTWTGRLVFCTMESS